MVRDFKKIEEEAFNLGIINKFTDERPNEDCDDKIPFTELLDKLMLRSKKTGSYLEAAVQITKELGLDDDVLVQLKDTRFGECLLEELNKRNYFGKEKSTITLF